MPNLNPIALLRYVTAFILLMHGVPSILTGGVHEFGTLYLDPLGFAPFGLAIAWLIKISHIACAVTLITNRYMKWPVYATISILVVGIFMVHLPNGWFVVGGGRNGVEFNVLLTVVLVSILIASQQKAASPAPGNT